jgi:hypothetical protein
MAIDIERFVAARPYLFHLTDRENLYNIQQNRTLQSATEWLGRGRQRELIRVRRKFSHTIDFSGIYVVLCDQSKLSEASIMLEEGFTFADLVELLNRQVFFWPGESNGPVPSGRRHFERYNACQPSVLRVPTKDLLCANPASEVRFCEYNSGSPRYSGGNPSPRGPRTFAIASEFPRGIGDVVEVTFADRITLPAETEVADSFDGPWRLLSSGSMNPRAPYADGWWEP